MQAFRFGRNISHLQRFLSRKSAMLFALSNARWRMFDLHSANREPAVLKYAWTVHPARKETACSFSELYRIFPALRKSTGLFCFQEIAFLPFRWKKTVNKAGRNLRLCRRINFVWQTANIRRTRLSMSMGIGRF